MMNTKTSAADRSNRSSTFVATAAVLCMLAGTPAGMAQSGQDNTDPGNAFGQVLGLLGGNSQDQTQPAADDDFRTDGVYYDDSMTVELHVQDEELTDVLQMLSLQSERNIVASNEVSARVTANLYGVTFHEALDAILHVNGYGYIEKGNFIYVYPAETLIGIEEANRQVEGQVFELSFLSAVDAADFVTPLLSESGTIKTNGQVGAWTDPTQPTGNEEFASESMLIVYDFPENIDAIGRMLETIDNRPAQILVEATIVQTSLNENNAFGVDFSLIADFDYADFASPLGAVDALVDGGDGTSRVPADGGATAIVGTPGNISGPGTFKAGVVSNDVAVFLRMLNEITSTSVISNPKVVTLNRQPGRVLVGRKVGYLQTTATDTSTTQSVEFLDTGTQLNFRPFIMGDGIIRMELKPQVSEAQLRSATDATGAAVTIPDEVTNELTANVMVPDGHTIVLGGLFREATTTARRQVPVLGDIPILGTAFRGHDDNVERQEIIFLITPSILSDQQMVAQGLRAEDSVRQVRAGSREGTLPFGQIRQSQQHLVAAEKLAAKGETNAALHKVRRALAHDPHNAQAIALREELVNQVDQWPSNSLLEDIINGAAAERKDLNIHKHGWKGHMVEASDEARRSSAVGGTRPRAPRNDADYTNNFQQRSAEFNRRNGTNPGNTGYNGNRRNPYSTSAGSTNNPYGDSTIGTPGYDESSWWASPEFDIFMTAWAAAAATEQGTEFDAGNRWWTTSQFRDFFGAYQTGTITSPEGNWWQSPEFSQFIDAWQDAAEIESFARGDTAGNTTRRNARGNTANGNTTRGNTNTGNTAEWWSSPEFKTFLTAWGEAAAIEQARTAGGESHWTDSPEFQQFLTVWSDAAAQEAATAADENAWWQSPEFALFMTTWANAAAAEQQQYAKAAEWWNSDAFKDFMAAFDTAVQKAEVLDKTEGENYRPSNNNYTNVPSDNND